MKKAKTKTYKTEAEAEVSPCSILYGALRSKKNFMLFMFNPKHYFFLGCSAVAIYGTYTIIQDEVTATASSLGNLDSDYWSVDVCVLACAGMWAAAFLSLFQVSMQESINRFRAMNHQLEKEVLKLGKQVDTLHDTADKLQDELENFSEIREAMAQYAAESGVEMGVLVRESSEMFDKMNRVARKNDMALLQKLAVDVEFRDGEEGMTFKEFKSFCARVPKHYRDKCKQDQEAKFKEIAGDDGVIQHAEITAFLRDLVETCCKPEASA